MTVLPALGLGTSGLRDGGECQAAVAAALSAGYRLFDTAPAYRNEGDVGAALAGSGVAREALFVIGKVDVRAARRPGGVARSVDKSLRALQLARLDCLVLHWPGSAGVPVDDAAAHREMRRRCWTEMMQAQAAGHTRYLGVANFLPRHFAEIDEAVAAWRAEHTDSPHLLTPLLNQLELHPLCCQTAAVAENAAREIVTQQCVALGQGTPRLLQHPGVAALTGPAWREPAEVLLAWAAARGYGSTLVRSRDESRLRRYKCILEMKLSSEQLAALNSLRHAMGAADGDDNDEHITWFSACIA